MPYEDDYETEKQKKEKKNRQRKKRKRRKLPVKRLVAMKKKKRRVPSTLLISRSGLLQLGVLLLYVTQNGPVAHFICNSLFF